MCPAAQGQRVLRPANGEEPGPGPRVPPPGLPAPGTVPRISCFTVLCLGFSWVVEGNVSRVGEDDKPWKPVPRGFTKRALGLLVFSDIMKSKSNPDFLKKDRSCVSRQLRSIRSKVSLGSSPCVRRAHLGPQQRVPRVPELTGPTCLACWASSRGFALSVSLAQQ